MAGDAVTSWFDESPETYDRARPSYPEPLWDEVFNRLPANPRLVEIGPGTGKATAALLERGASVAGCEPGSNLAGFLRGKFAGRRLDVINCSFEAAELAEGAFDGVIAATSFHWVAPEARMARTFRLLKPGGLLAVVDTEQVADEADRGYFAASQKIYRKYYPDDPEEMPTVPGRDVVPRAFIQTSTSELYETPELFRYDWDQRYETAAYIDLVRSYSNTAQMEPAAREAFLSDLASFIDAEFDGYVIRPLVITLCCARPVK